jgi:hypothetical protein
VYCGMVEYVIRMMWGIPHTTIPYNAISYGMVYDIILIGYNINWYGIVCVILGIKSRTKIRGCQLSIIIIHYSW